MKPQNQQPTTNPKAKVANLKTPQKAVRKVIPFPNKSNSNNNEPTPPAAA